MERGSKQFFTLIELLVVIAIIAILAGMLLPALNNARESGRSSDCINKQKQISSAILQYAGDNNEYALPMYTGTQGGGHWFKKGMIGHYLGVQDGRKAPYVYCSDAKFGFCTSGIFRNEGSCRRRNTAWCCSRCI